MFNSLLNLRILICVTLFTSLQTSENVLKKFKKRQEKLRQDSTARQTWVEHESEKTGITSFIDCSEDYVKILTLGHSSLRNTYPKVSSDFSETQ